MKFNLDQRIEYFKNMIILMSVLLVFGLALSAHYYPSTTQRIALLCFGPLVFTLGWCVGLMDVRRNGDK